MNPHNWIGDKILEDIEILLDQDHSKVDTILGNDNLVVYLLDIERFNTVSEKNFDGSGKGCDLILVELMEKLDNDFLILHTIPGHSPGYYRCCITVRME